MSSQQPDNSSTEPAVPGLLLRADGEARRPGILLLQEIFGLNASMRAIAEGFRTQGFDVFAPDLFWRQEPGVELDPTSAEGRARAETLMKGLDEHQALADIEQSVGRLKALDTASGKVAAVGYCLGGRLAYLTAAAGLVDAAVSYYGVAIHRSLNLAAKVTVPFLMHIARKDHLCDEQAQQDLHDAFDAKGNVTLHTYPDVGHAFARPNSPLWNEEAATKANTLTANFLRASLDARAAAPVSILAKAP